MAAARASPTWATSAGRLGRPRCGTGARYGESVSTIARSSGQAAAAARTSPAPLNVTIPENDSRAPRSRQAAPSSGPPVKQWNTVRSGTPSASSTANVSSHASRVWITSGMARSLANATWAANTSTWTPRGEWS